MEAVGVGEALAPAQGPGDSAGKVGKVGKVGRAEGVTEEEGLGPDGTGLAMIGGVGEGVPDGKTAAVAVGVGVTDGVSEGVGEGVGEGVSEGVGEAADPLGKEVVRQRAERASATEIRRSKK